MAAIGIFLARTTPSDDGEELANLEAFQAVGAKAFNRVFPLRTPGQCGTVPRAARTVPVAPGHDAQARSGAPSSAPSAYAQQPAIAERGRGVRARARRHSRASSPHSAGSKMWAMRKLGHAWLLTGPQLGFVMPERLVEIELHSPTLDVRGTTAAGAPVIGIGHNEHVAWGVTSGLGDEDDLYAEELVGDEGYRFRGETRAMECRDETFTYRPPPADFLALLDLEVPDTSSGSHTERSAGPSTARCRRSSRARASPTPGGTRSGSARWERSWGSTRSTARSVDRGRRQRGRRAHLEREPDGRRRPRQHRLLEPRPPPGALEALGRAASVPRHRAAPSGRASSRPTTVRR